MKKAPISFPRRWLSVPAPGSLRHTVNKRSRFVKLMSASAILLVIVAAVVWLLSGARSGHEVRPRLVSPASGPQGVSTVANRGLAVLPPSQVRAIKLPPGVFLAQVPFRHDPEHIGSPRRVPQSAAGTLGSMATRESPQASGRVGAWILAQRRYRVHRAILPWVDFSGFKLPTPSRLDAAMVSISLAGLHLATLPWPGCQVQNPALPGRFITALCLDKRGNIWVATEDHGVYRYAPSAPKGKQVTQFTKQNTHGQLGNNNIYALACDNHGRIWAGTLNHGVSVWKRFLVRGPMKLAIRVAKNYSLNTILQAAMLDPLSQHPVPYYYAYRAWQAHEKQRRSFRTKLAARWRSGQVSWHRHPADDSVSNPSGRRTDGSGLAAARQIIQILNVLEHRDPAAWAANQRLDYTSLLRWCVAHYGAIPKNSEAAAIAEKCYCHLGLFHRWEAVEKSRGMLVSRHIEKALRWDGVHESYRGYEFHVIRRYIWRLRHRRVAAAEN